MSRFTVLIVLLIVLALLIFSGNLARQTSPSRENNRITPTPKVTSKTSPSPGVSVSPSLELESFIYPGANVLSRNGNRLSMESQDDPQKISDWYKKKIETTGFNAKSFVQTEVNNNVLHRLIGRNDNIQYNVEVRKDKDERITTILVTRRTV